MEHKFTIKELSELYNLSTHSIRHYEKIGLITPKRMKNNYRIFTAEDIYKLNIISDLRMLDMPLEIINKYLNTRDVSSTKQLINQQIGNTELALKKLVAQLESLKKRDALLAELTKEPNILKFEIFGPRQIIEQSLSVHSEDAFEIEMLKLLKHVSNFKNVYDKLSIGGTAHRNNTGDLEYQSIFVTSSGDIQNEIQKTIIPQGLYACYRYSGDYNKVTYHLNRLINEIESMGYKAESMVYEFYLVDIRDTSYVQEYISELQVLIKKI
jgi:DNA-binding transcriptional MerR regulator